MSRCSIVVAASGVALAGLALAGCSSASTPSWLKPAPPPPQALQFESEPPGANVQTTQGQTCRTPCSLVVPATSQTIAFSMDGYTPQAVQVNVNQPERSLFSNPPPVLAPNPVAVTLQAIPVAKPNPKKAKVAAKAARPARSEQPSIAAPEPAAAPDHVFPPPPQMAAPASAFPPPPQSR